MKVSLVSIGNSKGIRLPKSVLDQCGVEDEFIMEIEDENIILKPVRNAQNLSFEDIKTMSDKEIQKLLKRTDAATLSIALIGADSDTKSRVFANLSEKVHMLIYEEINRLEKLDAKALIVEMQRAKMNHTLSELL